MSYAPCSFLKFIKRLVLLFIELVPYFYERQPLGFSPVSPACLDVAHGKRAAVRRLLFLVRRRLSKHEGYGLLMFTSYSEYKSEVSFRGEGLDALRRTSLPLSFTA